MKLGRRHLQAALELALDDLAEHKAAVAELGDRWRNARDLLDKERKINKATRDQLGEVRSDLGDPRAFDSDWPKTDLVVVPAEVADCTHGVGCPLHPRVNGVHNFDPICGAPNLHAPHYYEPIVNAAILPTEICTGGPDPRLAVKP